MLDAVLQFVYAYPGVLVLGTPILLLLGVVWWFGRDRVFGVPMHVYVASAESDDDDIYVVPGDHEKRLHLAEANQGEEDDDTFRG